MKWLEVSFVIKKGLEVIPRNVDLRGDEELKTVVKTMIGDLNYREVPYRRVVGPHLALATSPEAHKGEGEMEGRENLCLAF